MRFSWWIGLLQQQQRGSCWPLGSSVTFGFPLSFHVQVSFVSQNTCELYPAWHSMTVWPLLLTWMARWSLTLTGLWPVPSLQRSWNRSHSGGRFFIDVFHAVGTKVSTHVSIPPSLDKNHVLFYCQCKLEFIPTQCFEVISCRMDSGSHRRMVF